MVDTINSPDDPKPEEPQSEDSPTEEASSAPAKRFDWIKQRLAGLLPSRDSLRALQTPGGRRAIIAVIGGYSLLTMGLGYYWSLPPDSFDVVDNRDRYLAPKGQPITGAATTAALLEVTRLLLEKMAVT